ncbi:uncharacterized protein DNG_00129 [Cephalotrichum gorgonifer]|uniref:Uncharacterized protein n=1 Tax=Cephalotrichum gorgonifer TaxID=2041049 RepID=A0AAE8MN82_9PEZI|nr:uncharacterized protein DNG_00129 [Cephalotrichum gorgonifer]
MPDYIGIPPDGQGSWSYFNPEGKSKDIMERIPNGNVARGLNKVPANTPDSIGGDESKIDGLSLSQTNAVPTQGQSQAPSPNMLSSEIVESGDLSDEAIMQMLANS